MKKKQKCALGLVAAMAAVMALGSCEQVIESKSGSILTYTDANGVRTSYTAEDLFGDYRESSSSLSSEFDQVYEAMVRHYYKNSSKLASLEAKAREAVIADKNTAQKNAGDTGDYAAEFEKIMANHGCDNAQELYEYHLYQEEKQDFESSMYADWNTGIAGVNGVEALKDGSYKKGDETVSIMNPSAEWGIGNEGWLKEQVPFHTRHILVKLASASSGNYTQDKISESEKAGEGGETTKLANIMVDLAGAAYDAEPDVDHPGKVLSSEVKTAAYRKSFGEIANASSDDGSSTSYGDVSTNDNPAVSKVMSSEFVPEYKLGLFAYESLYKADSSDYHADNKYRITPGLAKDADKTSTADPTQVLDDTGETVYDFFDDMGIGSIPFGAAVALLDHANDIKDFNNATVNDGNNAFYPRNVLFNKYFNKRNICVITPNAIMSNANSTNAATAAAAATAADTVVGGTVTSQDYDGAYSSDYGALPGFSVDTTNILPQFANNVLTDETGNIVLAVRAMSSGYQGIHFIVVQRSGLSLYGSKLDETTNQYVDLDSAEEDPSVATLSEYWTTYTPTSGNYPTYTDDEGKKVNKTTYVNLNKQLTSDISARASGLAGVIKSYNSNLDTYHFEWLVENNKVTFADEQLEADMKSYCSTKRSNTVDSAFDTRKDNWKSYAEALEVQEQSRDITWEAADGRGTTGNGDGLGWLLPESVVAGFNDPSVRENNALWEKGGACYYED